MRSVSDIELIDTLRRLRELEHENERLREVLKRAVCGDVMGADVACQLPRNHEGSHANLSPTGDVLIRW